MRQAVVIDAVLTPIGRYGGALSSVRPGDRAALASNAEVETAGRCPHCGSAGAYLEKDATPLPRQSPDLDPDEFLNQDIESNALGRRRPVNQTAVISNRCSYLRRTQRQPNVVKNYFHTEPVRYPAR